MTRRQRRAAQSPLRLLIAGDHAGAETAALAAPSGDATAQQVLGVVAYQRGDHAGACERFRQVVEIDPENADGHYNLAEALKRLLRYDDAIPVYRRALELNPQNADLWINFGFVLIDRSRFGEAVEASQAALALQPTSVFALQNLSIAQWAAGYVAEGIETVRRAIDLDPANGAAWSNLLMYLQYSADHGEDALMEAARAYGCTMDRPRVGPEPLNVPEPTKLRIGYVSGDFCDHPVAYAMEKVLAGHDRSRFEVVLYSTSGLEDAVAARLRGLADGWRDLSALDDEHAARRIAADGVHVLIDLSGHTARNRLGVFAYRPAPVQASWLGYFATTGLPGMDFVLRDRAQIPVGEEGCYTERVWAIEDASFGYRPLPGCPDLTPLPARRNGFVTFGAFANPAKLSEACVRAWARVLHAVPGSRMVLDRKGLDEPLGRDRVLALFAQNGIGPERLDLGGSRGHLAYMARYAEVDVVLDTFPCNGATTTYEALWMGVPVVSRRWGRMVGHFAESILAPLGHADWVADDEDGYVARAVALSGDLGGLSSLRASLREELAGSSLCRADDCARGLERAYEGMWRAVRGPVSDAENVALLERAIAARPVDAHNWFEIVAPLARLGRVAEAFAAFERASALDPSGVVERGGAVFADLGDALAAGRRFEEAVVCFAESVKLSEGIADPEAVRARAMRMLEKAATPV